ncbi:(Fe-S)-binding protein [Ancylomarina salipaludis]|uniref:(Fe-S)-binding protein n=1 Tax=Ancylomarina salipaludis TaxID=2501299 RepID=A0A4Q1JNL4_9BACT|nr:(Fe-S)-binding protein [Ancylomarina salipaludis]RXQ95660.1 (Fe-S)-binding protein [Ancylomarina salipaludis]
MTTDTKIDIPVMADLAAEGKQVDYLYWVGCAGAYDLRYQKVARSFAKILNHLKVNYAVLGTEESCTGDAAKRAGNEMLFQMQAMQNIEILNAYGIKKIICTCPHCYNTLKNEYPDLGGHYELINYTEFLDEQIKLGNLKLDSNPFLNESITYHDPCYLGRGNKIYDAPRNIVKAVYGEVKEMKRCKSSALCCGAGGAQMFKDAEKGDKEVNIERIEDVLEQKVDKLATACPFCMTMLTDGIKFKNKEDEVENLDLAEIVAQALGL